MALFLTVPTPQNLLLPPSCALPGTRSALAPVPVPISVLSATAITDDDMNGDKSNSTSAHYTEEIPRNSEETTLLLEPMFR